MKLMKMVYRCQRSLVYLHINWIQFVRIPRHCYVRQTIFYLLRWNNFQFYSVSAYSGTASIYSVEYFISLCAVGCSVVSSHYIILNDLINDNISVKTADGFYFCPPLSHKYVGGCDWQHSWKIEGKYHRKRRLT